MAGKEQIICYELTEVFADGSIGPSFEDDKVYSSSVLTSALPVNFDLISAQVDLVCSVAGKGDWHFDPATYRCNLFGNVVGALPVDATGWAVDLLQRVGFANGMIQGNGKDPAMKDVRELGITLVVPDSSLLNSQFAGGDTPTFTVRLYLKLRILN